MLIHQLSKGKFSFHLTYQITNHSEKNTFRDYHFFAWYVKWTPFQHALANYALSFSIGPVFSDRELFMSVNSVMHALSVACYARSFSIVLWTLFWHWNGRGGCLTNLKNSIALEFCSKCSKLTHQLIFLSYKISWIACARKIRLLAGQKLFAAWSTTTSWVYVHNFFCPNIHRNFAGIHIKVYGIRGGFKNINWYTWAFSQQEGGGVPH